jgi:hypothetical protein
LTNWSGSAAAAAVVTFAAAVPAFKPIFDPAMPRILLQKMDVERLSTADVRSQSTVFGISRAIGHYKQSCRPFAIKMLA